ncbi:hypothetical protein GQ53DRAFT_850860 [Thozetella sp. PMI_491]|nr:hypothetical protein GQ53DRAFT_850860 [Thozetella sp. PMI_491]
MYCLIPIVKLAVLAGLMHLTAAGIVAKQLYKFPDATWIENLAIRHNGELILSTISKNTLFTFNSIQSQPHVAIQLPNVTAVTGIAEIAPDLFVIPGGTVHEANVTFTNNFVFVVDFSGCRPKLKKAFPALPGFPNGATAMPSCSGVALISDSRGGAIWRVDTHAGTVESVFQDASLASVGNNLGINGIRIFDGYLYYTTTTTGILGRMTISDDGRKLGKLEQVAKLADISAGAFDDFAIDKSGVVYAAVHPNILQKIWPDGTQETLIGGNSTLLNFTTSVAIDNSRKSLFVTTAGLTREGTNSGGQVFKVEL